MLCSRGGAADSLQSFEVDLTLLYCACFFFGNGRFKLLKVAECGVKLITQVPAKNAVALIGFAQGLYGM